MTVCVALTGSGGWPLTIVMTPDQKPFFAATYLPRDDRYGRPGMLNLLPRIARLWKEDRARVLAAGSEMAGLLSSNEPRQGVVAEEVLRAAGRQYASLFDGVHGGFGDAPKFPGAHNLSLLLRLAARFHDTNALAMAERTLAAMASGGIWDHVASGFHRYSVDAEWLVPHFEKMLYDQALLATAYCEAFKMTRTQDYAAVARQVFTYVLRDMTSPDGAFYSSEDADSEGGEGAFYTWPYDELTNVLGADAAAFCALYGATPEGNFEGRVILHLEGSRSDSSGIAGTTALLTRCREKLHAARAKRPRPPKDDKILTDWNGLMIAALATGAQALQMPEYAAAAERAASFILRSLRARDGRLLHRYRNGQAAIPGFIDDYAFFIRGLIELYQATGRTEHLAAACSLAEQMIALFWDDAAGAFFHAGSDAEKLIARTKEFQDGAIPSGNSVAALDLLQLGRMTGRRDWEEKAARLIAANGAAVAGMPTAYAQMLIALDFQLGPTAEIVLAGDPADETMRAMIRAVQSRFLPHALLIVRTPGDTAHDTLMPDVAAYEPLDGMATAYVCRNFTCEMPVNTVEELEKKLEKMSE